MLHFGLIRFECDLAEHSWAGCKGRVMKAVLGLKEFNTNACQENGFVCGMRDDFSSRSVAGNKPNLANIPCNSLGGEWWWWWWEGGGVV